MLLFGSGIAVLVPSGTNPTPIQVGTLQDISVDEKWTEKELRGRYQAPEDVARAELAVTGKIKMARINGAFLTAIRAGATSATGQTSVALNEQSSIPTTPYQITVTHSGTFVENLGVYDVTQQLNMVRVAASPATGQYSLSGGVYTFAAADTTNVVQITYTYTLTGGFTVSYTNQLMGAATTFELHLWNQYTSSTGLLGQTYTKFGAARLPSLTTTIKNTDYTMYDLDFAVSADSTGTISTTSVSD